MSAIYQKARPQTFKQVIGQEHVIDILTVALERNRIGHAYLFSGPRGVGKTTTARLLAMSVNCESSDKPCGQCESCQLIKNGNHPDVIELDAASNNSVEDIRDLREKVQLAAMRGGTRVWVLDEAHMLSRAASNALLKTLEEPPENLVFILATTEPEKLPATILSRCQHFRFRRLSVEEIKSKLIKLCAEAKVESDDQALAMVAQSADGAMRDAESFLERLLASGKKISLQIAEDALGLPPKEQMQKLSQHLTKQDLGKMLSLAAELYHQGFAPSSLLVHLVKTLRDALANKVLENDDFKLDIEQKDELRIIHALDDEMERFSRRDNLFGLELALIKALNTLNYNRPDEQLSQEAPSLKTPAIADFDPHASKKPKVQSRVKQAVKQATAKASKISWYEIQKNAGVHLKAFLIPAQETIEGNHISLNYQGHNFHYQQVLKREGDLLELIHKLYGDEIQLTIKADGQTAKKKPLTLSRKTTPKPTVAANTDGKSFIEPKSKKTIVKNKTVSKEDIPVSIDPAKEVKTEKNTKPSNAQNIKKLATTAEFKPEFPDDVPADFWDAELESVNIEEISNYNQQESFDNSSNTPSNPITEQKTKIPQETAVNTASDTTPDVNVNKTTVDENPILEVDYPLFNELEKLFPGKITKIEKNKS